MASYYYLISSLPMLKTQGEPPMDYAAFLAMCKSAVSSGVYQTLEELTAAVNAENPLEGERLLLDLEFRRLDGMIGLHNFDDHALFGYAMKLQLLERQRTFRYEAGKQAFDELMAGIRQQVSSL